MAGGMGAVAGENEGAQGGELADHRRHSLQVAAGHGERVQAREERDLRREPLLLRRGAGGVFGGERGTHVVAPVSAAPVACKVGGTGAAGPAWLPKNLPGAAAL